MLMLNPSFQTGVTDRAAAIRPVATAKGVSRNHLTHLEIATRLQPLDSEIRVSLKAWPSALQGPRIRSSFRGYQTTVWGVFNLMVPALPLPEVSLNQDRPDSVLPL